MNLAEQSCAPAPPYCQVNSSRITERQGEGQQQGETGEMADLPLILPPISLLILHLILLRIRRREGEAVTAEEDIIFCGTLN